VAFDVGGPAHAGAAEHDPVAALVFCASVPASLVAIDGRVVVRDGELATLPLAPLLEAQRGFARRLAVPG
jgi:hypothetical protein